MIQCGVMCNIVNYTGMSIIAIEIAKNLHIFYVKIFCIHFQGLRMNRTLLSLNLGSNLIGDIGASKLAEVRCKMNSI